MSGTMMLEAVRGGVRPFVEWVERSRQPTAEETAEVVAHADVPVFLLEQLWDAARAMLDRGVEHAELLRVLKDVVGQTDRCVRAFTDVLTQSDSPGLDPTGATRLEAATKKLVAMRAASSNMLQWLETPPPPIDISRLPKSSGEPGAAGYISAKEMASRLRDGSPR